MKTPMALECIEARRAGWLGCCTIETDVGPLVSVVAGSGRAIRTQC